MSPALGGGSKRRSEDPSPLDEAHRAKLAVARSLPLQVPWAVSLTSAGRELSLLIRRFAAVYGLTVALVFAACDNSMPGLGRINVDTLPSGAVHVQNHPLDANSPPPGWRIEEVLRIGAGADAPPEETFGRIRGVALDDNANVFILDDQANEVRVFSSSGVHLRTIGRSGAGPGEFAGPDGLHVSSEGLLWVRDPRNRRYSVFNLDGTLQKTYAGAPPMGTWDPVVDEHGRIWESRTSRFDMTTFDAERTFVGFVARDTRMEGVDTMRRPAESGGPVWTVTGGATSGDGTMVEMGGTVRVPFAPQRRDRVDPKGGFWSGYTDALRFARISPQGDTVLIVERVSSPRPISSSERRNAVEDLRERFGSSLDVDLSTFPQHLPLWSTFFVDPEGRLWVERYRSPSGAETGALHTWEIYDSGGPYLGAVKLPLSGAVTPAIRNGFLAGAFSDSMGIPQVVVFKVDVD